MANILLLEPNYSAKYPPLGLMKISYYHKHIRHDSPVFFAKGKIPETSLYANLDWDRIYVSTMFTYEWKETIKTIEYAKQLLDGNVSKIFVGGIASTLMPEDFERETGIRPIIGLLNEPGKLGYDDDHLIDCLPPDYSMLDDVSYKYESANNYFAYTTRGCGMNCSFCAVKTLEPKYIDRVSITNQISQVRALDQANGGPGELRRDLLLLDNNVLRSKRFPEIIEEIKQLGFHKGATFLNQKTGKTVIRSVDFNQGLDANLLTVEKAKLLGQIAIKPARIAFDHIEDKDIYTQAILRCVDVGITEFSNYILYNAEASSGKGRTYSADKPEDLYNRLRITLDLKEEINKTSKDRVFIYSFPMKYIPLDATDRSFIGPNWNRKFLRTIQVMLTPTMGKGVSSRSYFEAAFGKDVEEFCQFLLMPEALLAGRGRLAKSNKSGNLDSKRLRKEQENTVLIQYWKKYYTRLKNKDHFNSVIAGNSFSNDTFYELEDLVEKKLYLFYLSPKQFLDLLDGKKTRKAKSIIRDFCEEVPEYYDYILHHIYDKNYHFHLLQNGFYLTFGYHALNQLVIEWIRDGCRNDFLITNLENLIISVRDTHIDINALKALHSFYLLDILDIDQYEDHLIQCVLSNDYEQIWMFLYEQESLLDQLITEKEKAGEDSVTDVLIQFKSQLHYRQF